MTNFEVPIDPIADLIDTESRRLDGIAVLVPAMTDSIERKKLDLELDPAGYFHNQVRLQRGVSEMSPFIRRMIEVNEEQT